MDTLPPYAPMPPAYFRSKRKRPVPKTVGNAYDLVGRTVRGTWANGGVTVSGRDQMELLYNAGCFGKSTHSRGTPLSIMERFVGPRLGVESDEASGAVVSGSVVSGASSLRDVGADGKRRVGSAVRNVHRVDEQSMFALGRDEVLMLRLEEAYYLVREVGCLAVYDTGEDAVQPLTCAELWRRCVATVPLQRFPYIYFAYRHFRGKGWVPRSGLKYGADMVLYRVGPSYFHADFSVQIIVVNRATQEAMPNEPRAPSWRLVQNMSRLSVTVSKGLMRLYVHAPPRDDAAQWDVATDACVEQLAAQECQLRRWNARRGRETEDEQRIIAARARTARKRARGQLARKEKKRRKKQKQGVE